MHMQVTRREQFGAAQSGSGANAHEEEAELDASAGKKRRKQQVMKRPAAKLAAAQAEPCDGGEGVPETSEPPRGRGRGRGRGGRGRGGLKTQGPSTEEWSQDEWDEWVKWQAERADRDASNLEVEAPVKKPKREPKDAGKSKKNHKAAQPEKEIGDEKATFAGRRQPAHGLPHLKWQVIKDCFIDNVRPHVHVQRWKHEARPMLHHVASRYIHACIYIHTLI